MTLLRTTLAALLALAAAPVRADPAAPELRFAPYQVKDGTYGGSITGTVILTGAAPKAFPVKHTRDQTVCGDSGTDDSLVVDAQGGIADAIVVLDISAGKKVEPRKDVTLDQKGCAYAPRVQAVALGSTLTLRNDDPLLHTVHSWLGDQSVFNKAEPLKGDHKAVELKKVGLLTVKCDIHNWMRAYIAVVPHPYFAVTDSHGAFHLEGVPPGQYPLQVWQERLGMKEAKVQVPEKGAASVAISFAAP